MQVMSISGSDSSSDDGQSEADRRTRNQGSHTVFQSQGGKDCIALAASGLLSHRLARSLSYLLLYVHQCAERMLQNIGL